MGTMIHLSLGAFQIDWGKNNFFLNHACLFQAQDLKPYVSDYGYDEPILTEGYSKPLGALVQRLELMGYNLAAVKREYNQATDEDGEKIKHGITFTKLHDLVKTIDINKVTGKWSKDETPHFIPAEIINSMGGYSEYQNSRPDYWDLQMVLEGLSPYAILRLLAENSINLDVPVIWPFGQTVESGWAKREEMLTSSPASRYLIVTEGSSDSKILKKAFELLRPNIAEFFHFVDMEEGYPFSGTGNLHRFCQGLVSIGIQNQVIILYDNDAEGVSKYIETKLLSIPPNMAVTKLPALRELKRMDTVGPSGRRKADINGTAASIECYLDLTYEAKFLPRIRWSNYVEKLDCYQGGLEGKTSFMKTFLKLRKAEQGYDFTKIGAVLDHLYDLSVGLASNAHGVTHH